MKIIIEEGAKRFNYEWVFSGFNYSFESNFSYCLLGPNGSGKSTLLQIIAGFQSLSSGKISFQNEKSIDNDLIFREITFCAPYQELIEEMTLNELIKFHFQFKTLRKDFSQNSLTELFQLQSAGNKTVKNFSSGMKQRVKLGLAFAADTQILLLDEPLNNLDENGFTWFHEMVKSFTKDRLVIVASNQLEEYSFCKYQLNLSGYKSIPA
jgi:ABC-type multidrug transport system ATPase subunit